jgi:hypothetical protein
MSYSSGIFNLKTSLPRNSNSNSDWNLKWKRREENVKKKNNKKKKKEFSALMGCLPHIRPNPSIAPAQEGSSCRLMT